ncbi:uncharacterized protein LOC128999798 [Macrosteles quadrilineatus]|uniref:uncharacterized protein LOC128999798 n=1 Tax=Macrosteles quadrilineatus TaxID=74068 RepID=UPI0023E2F5A9|nr:uncharacterized protein LOC128999798 [Macrosteles quadrilineatus]
MNSDNLHDIAFNSSEDEGNINAMEHNTNIPPVFNITQETLHDIEDMQNTFIPPSTHNLYTMTTQHEHGEVTVTDDDGGSHFEINNAGSKSIQKEVVVTEVAASSSTTREPSQSVINPLHSSFKDRQMSNENVVTLTADVDNGVKDDSKVMQQIQTANPDITCLLTGLFEEIRGIGQSQKEMNSKIENLTEQLENKFNQRFQVTEGKIEELFETQSQMNIKLDQSIKLHQNTAVKMQNIEHKCQTENQRTRQEFIHEIETRVTSQGQTFENALKNQSSQITNYFVNKLDEQAKNLKIQIQNEKLISKKEDDEKLKESILDLENKIIPQIKQNTDSLNQQQNEISRLTDTVNQISQQKFQTTIPHNGNINVICPSSDPILSNRTLPKFNGKSHNPNEFLLKLKRYYDRSAQRYLNSSDAVENLREIIEVSLEHHAARWFQLIREDIYNWENFANEFRLKYWSRDVQQYIKRKIETESYKSNGSLSRADFFMERAITLQSMTPPIPENEIVLILSECFDQLINDARAVQNITTIKGFITLLEREDLRDPNRRTRNTNPQPPREQDNNQYRNQHSRRDNNINHNAYRPNHHQNNRPPYHQQPNHHNSNRYQEQGQNRYQSQENRPPYHQPTNNYPRGQQNQPNRSPPPNHPTQEQNQVCSMFGQQQSRQNLSTPNSPNHQAVGTSNF